MQFLQRTDDLAARLGCRLLDLPEKIGISERSLFGYRSGKNPVTAKALRKLQAAERAAGIDRANVPATTGKESFEDYKNEGFVVRESEVEYRVEKKQQIFPTRLEEIRAQVAAIQEELEAMAAEPPEFTMESLIFWMNQAHAWPPSDQDRKRSPGQLWKKYAPP